jgi:hypothetical protein
MSAILLGIGVLSKEILVVVVPAYALLVALRADRSQRWLATMGWLALGLSVSSLWVLFAVLKGELLPPGVPFSGSGPHVSLVQTLLTQAARGRDGGLLVAGSRFWQAAITWVTQDPILVAGGTVASILAVASIRRAASAGAIGLAVLSFWAFLGRGGETLDFYLVPLLPLLALQLAWGFDLARTAVRRVAASALLARAPRLRAARGLADAVLAAAVVVAGCGSLARSPGSSLLWSSAQADSQRAAIAWVRSMLPPTSTLVIDMFAWPDLQQPASAAPRFVHADYYWKVEEDPAIRDAVLANDWHTVDYVMATPDLYGDAAQLPFIRTILDHADAIRNVGQGGWPVTIERTRTLRNMPASTDPLLQGLWSSWTSTSLPSGSGAGAAATLTPAVVANAMLQAVYMDDHAAFASTWDWVRSHLLGADGLLHPAGTAGSAGAASGATRDPGADTDAALALLFAAHRWGDPAEFTSASAMIDAIWSRETAVVAGERVVVAAGPTAIAPSSGPILLDTSALAPYAYRLFGGIDPAHPWQDVVDGTYAWLARLRLDPAVGGPAGVLPHRIVVDPRTDEVTPVGGTLGGAQFDAAASELQWRVGLDLLWNEDARALGVLQWLSVPRRAVEAGVPVARTYALDGLVATAAPSVQTSATVLPSVLAAGKIELAAGAFSTGVLAPVLDAAPGTVDASSLGWAWFATALMDGGLVDLTLPRDDPERPNPTSRSGGRPPRCARRWQDRRPCCGRP